MTAALTPSSLGSASRPSSSFIYANEFLSLVEYFTIRSDFLKLGLRSLSVLHGARTRPLKVLRTIILLSGELQGSIGVVNLRQELSAKHRQQRSEKQNAIEEPHFRDWRSPRCILSGLTKCGCCGGGYSMISSAMLGCSTARNKETCDNKLNIRRDELESRVLKAIRYQLMDPSLFKFKGGLILCSVGSDRRALDFLAID